MAAIVAILLRFTLNRSRPYFQRLDLITASTPLFLVDLEDDEILVGLLVTLVGHDFGGANSDMFLEED
ncbi:hypothetical protein NOF04DRAFT_22482 [Fusarium oxysporum II5]|uniref:Uncharacterized protein n=2 Tax=Fusarium oxysporum species complex TaxID=171631 RepID=X0IML6_FUSO5|nr:uncharacterized protein FOIG_16620 [Fusarium odoratissimum NRRL 54006]EXL90107.1 hypothetical protein FOIG_16620 [Fusarium odoratissimum NRRL 54006]KAK2126478.1 hypothetical protein NOF04DRAFT_22482 [Fusarium oxysporum II5]TXB98249.1 hypothetical protein FocTR4_00012320 [Fusarium oxysporum f. sp. cubense]